MATKKRARAKKKPAPRYVLILRTCAADMTSHGGFKWPKKGRVQCKDWKPTPTCGNGLHGLLWGEGDASLMNWSDDAKWLVVKVRADEVVKIDDAKVKFPRGEVLCCGDRLTATSYLVQYGEAGHAVHGATVASGDGGTSTSGYGGTSTSGDGGTSTSGVRGTSTSGDGGTSTSGDRGTSTSGDGGELRIRWYDGTRYRLAVGYVGENGIKPNVKYRADEKGNLVEVTS